MPFINGNYLMNLYLTKLHRPNGDCNCARIHFEFFQLFPTNSLTFLFYLFLALSLMRGEKHLFHFLSPQFSLKLSHGTVAVDVFCLAAYISGKLQCSRCVRVTNNKLDQFLGFLFPIEYFLYGYFQQPKHSAASYLSQSQTFYALFSIRFLSIVSFTYNWFVIASILITCEMVNYRFSLLVCDSHSFLTKTHFAPHNMLIAIVLLNIVLMRI